MPSHKKRTGLPQISNYIACNKFLSALNESKIGVVICDRHLRYKALNESLAKMHNVSIKAHLGHSLHQILGDLSKQITPYWESVLLTGKPLLNLEVTGKLPKRSGIGRWIENLFPLTDSRGRIMQVGCLVTEIDQAPMHSDSIPALSSKANPARAADSLTLGSHNAITLSERERDVLRLLAEGNSNKEVSSVLEISVRTVEAYRARLMLKLQAPTFAHLVHYAIRNSIVKL